MAIVSTRHPSLFEDIRMFIYGVRKISEFFKNIDHEQLTKKELMTIAKKKKIKGRHSMNKTELIECLK